MASKVNYDFQSVPAFLMYNKKSVLQERKVKRKKRKHGPVQEVVSKKQKNQKEMKQHTAASEEASRLCEQYNIETEEPPTLVTINETSCKQSTTITSKRQKSKISNEHDLLKNDDPTLDALHLFKWIIDPISPDLFFKTYWERQALYIKRLNKNYYTHILNTSALDKMLRNNQLYYTRNVDVVCYENGVKEVHNQEGRATPSALWDYYSNGCSIRILNPQTYSHKVHLLLATLQEYFGTMVGANVYLTPPGSQGFAPHYDDIEAFIIQLEGRKHWKLYQPKAVDVLARYSSPNFKHEDIGEPFMEVTLNAGEMLYFPRGTIHEGRTDPNSHSLHITVSVYQQTSYVDLLQHILPDALKKAADSELEFRKGLPLNYLKLCGGAASSQIRNPLQTTVENLMHSLVKYVDIDRAADLLGKKFMHDSMPPVLSRDESERSSKGDGPYLNDGKVVNRVEIGLDTRIRLLRYYCIRLVNETNSTPKLYYNTENATVYHGEEEQWLELDPSMIPSIRLLQNAYPCYLEVENLPMEDVAIKMQLVSDLWEHGLIVTEYPLETIDDE